MDLLETLLSKIPTWILFVACTFLIRFWIKNISNQIKGLVNKVDYIGDQTESIHSGLGNSLNGKYAAGYKEGYDKTMTVKEHERERLQKNIIQ